MFLKDLTWKQCLLSKSVWGATFVAVPLLTGEWRHFQAHSETLWITLGHVGAILGGWLTATGLRDALEGSKTPAELLTLLPKDLQKSLPPKMQERVRSLQQNS